MNELTYTMVGDYSLPNLKLPQQPEVTSTENVLRPDTSHSIILSMVSEVR